MGSVLGYNKMQILHPHWSWVFFPSRVLILASGPEEVTQWLMAFAAQADTSSTPHPSVEWLTTPYIPSSRVADTFIRPLQAPVLIWACIHTHI